MKLLYSYTFGKLLLITALMCVCFNAAAQPSPAFTATPVSGCTPLVVSFTDQTTGGATAWEWDLGNGTTSTQQNPTTTYFNAGLYTVTLKVTNAVGSNTLTKSQYIKVDDKPTVNFAASSTAGCFPLRVNFTDASTGGSAGIVSWEWDFGDGTLSTQQNPLKIYTTAGNYSVTLKVTNAGGCSRVISRPNYIQVNDGIRIVFSNTNPILCKPPETINFTSLSTGPGTLSYSWLFGDGGTASIQNPSHTYLTGGNFNVSLIVQSSDGCIDTLTKPALFSVRNVNTDFTIPATVCLGVPLTIANTSVPVATTSFWDFGDATTSTQTSPTKTYTAVGTYQIRLRNNYGTCADSATKQITVLPLPTPNFSAPDVTDCKVPFTVNFADASTGATGWRWEFGDGGTSTQQNPSHTYTTLGTYTIKLVATGANGCSDSLIRTQYVRIQAPTVAINNLPREGCVPYTINPTPNVSAPDGIATYRWDFGDGNTSNAANPSHTYPIQGTYTVKLIVTTNGGCTDSAVIVNAVRVGNRSVPDFSATPTSQCAAQNIQFTNLTSPSDRWLWDFGNGVTSTLENPIHAYQDTFGLFTVKLIAWNNGCSDSITKANYITIRPPVARFRSIFNCNNKLQVSFTDESLQPQTWLWNFGDGNTSTAQNPVHTYAAFGTYNVSLTVTNGTCSHTRVNQVILFNEQADFRILDDTICAGQEAIFEVTGVNFANISTYYWDFGAGYAGLANTVVAYRYSTPGVYTVTLTITDVNGCVSTISKPNALRAWGPQAAYTPNPANGCRPLTVTFADNTITDGVHPVVSWLWNYGDGTTQTLAAPPFTHTYDSIGTFNPILQVTDSYGCTNTSSLINPVFVTKPQAEFYSPDSLTCIGTNVRFFTNSTGVSISHVWNFGDGTTSTAANPIKTYASDGAYVISLTVTDVNGCTNTATKNAYIKVTTVKAAFTVQDSISSCVPFEVKFTNTSQYSKTVRWNFGNGSTSTLNNPTHYFSQVGTFTVKLLAAGPGDCFDSAFKTITVYPSTATLTYTPLVGCSPLPVTFTASTPGPVTYLWDFNDGTTIATTTPSITYNYVLPGEFLPKVVLEDQSGCKIPVVGIDTIFVTKSDVNFFADDSVHCSSALVNFTDSTKSNRNIASYFWQFGDGATSTLQNPSHFYASTGAYTVSLITTTTNGCQDTLIKPNYIKVVANPVADVDGVYTFCVYNKLQVRGLQLAPDTSALKWNWTFGNGKTYQFQNPPGISYDTAGAYPLQLIVTNSTGCADTVDRTIIVWPKPAIEAGPNRTILVGTQIPINPTGDPVVDNLWSPPLGLSCTSCYNTIAAPKNTTAYTIKVTDANGCINTDVVTIIVTCNEDNIFVPNTFSPNNDGVNDWFYPRGKGLFKIQGMRIFNRWGEMVFQKTNLTPNDPLSGWNGRYNGKLLTTDVYTYIIEIICENSEIVSYKGNVSLIQ
jgi:gliding motility-associated-like protein